GHEIHTVGQILPGSGDPAHVGLSAKFSFGADLTSHAGHFRRERTELVHHGVDGVLQLQNFAFNVDSDLFREIAARDCGGHVRDVADLTGQIARHKVDRIRQVLPRSRNTYNPGLTAKNSL